MFGSPSTPGHELAPGVRSVLSTVRDWKVAYDQYGVMLFYSIPSRTQYGKRYETSISACTCIGNARFHRDCVHMKALRYALNAADQRRAAEEAARQRTSVMALVPFEG